MALAILASLVIGFAPAASADGVNVRSGPGSAADGMFLTYLGCDGFFAPSSAPRTRVNLGPGTAPIGRRSFGLVPSGAGTASGPYVPFLSLAGAGASVSVTAAAGTTGASYIWTSAADAPAGHAWLGRTTTTVPAGGWHTVDTASLRYDWKLVDLVTGSSTAGAPATPAEFVAAHGDGTGYVVTGFGCDGNAFNIDAVRGVGQTWDFEGITLGTAITASAPQVPAGHDVVISGHVTDGFGRVTGDPVLLQARTPGAAEWRTVSELAMVGPDGWSRATAKVTEDTEFRWFRPHGEYADEGASESVLVRATAVPPPPPEQQQPTPEQPQQPQPSPEQPQTTPGG
ncbi:hypothetical protein ASG88_19010 [Nocardioides sp. Soil777]|uniref:hypothetical protein n=1 Tax=Nocardioides sp. Soil777 TaxID=1736409 RepID=UPI00070398D6|nr:hypothetical protein [Nocardioides sp. Soil777]KRF07010.1 hypothetical protein ASG88_19010 [Nocardioides sp. Soil777]